MAKLINTTQSQILAQTLHEATNFWQRAKGLIGETSLGPGEALWIHRCNSVHTWFMRFPIDVIFVDRHLVVKSICFDLPPWRLSPWTFSAHSVVEFASGQPVVRATNKGDQLDVAR